MFGLALCFVYVLLLSFQHFDHLARGRGSWSLCLSCDCLLTMYTLICVIFSLPPGVRGWLGLLLVALPGPFCLPFCLKIDSLTVLSKLWNEVHITVKPRTKKVGHGTQKILPDFF